MAAPTETELHGGTANRGQVVRVGDTVRRPRGPGADGVRALLLHLERVGFDGAPRYLGEDERGREVLEYVPGDVPTEPYPAWARTDDVLRGVGRLVRRFHEAVAGFDPSPYRWGSAVPAAYRGGLVTHNDANLDNVVFRGGRPVALIDFDLASPGSRVWDVALAARLWVPLRDPVDVPHERARRAPERLRLFADAYGLSDADGARLAAAARATHRWCYDTVRAGVAQGRPGFVRYWTPRAQEHDRRGLRWLDRNQARLAAALTTPDP